MRAHGMQAQKDKKRNIGCGPERALPLLEDNIGNRKECRQILQQPVAPVVGLDCGKEPASYVDSKAR